MYGLQSALVAMVSIVLEDCLRDKDMSSNGMQPNKILEVDVQDRKNLKQSRNAGSNRYMKSVHWSTSLDWVKFA